MFPNAYVINWDSNKEEIINELKDKDEYLILGMIWACGEWFDLPAIQCGILFYSTSWEWSLEQAIGRSRRFNWDKQYGYRCDFQEYSKIEPDMYRTFWARDRLKWYKEKWFEINPL